MKQLSLLGYNPTRWNGKYIMLERFQKYTEIIQEVIEEYDENVVKKSRLAIEFSSEDFEYIGY